MSNFNIQIKNLPEIRAAFAKAPTLMNTEYKQALIKSGLSLAAKSVRNAPHQTGFLKASHWLRGRGGVDLHGNGLNMSVDVGPTADYAGFVHDGTRFQRAQPFLKDAAESMLYDIQDNFNTATQNVFDKIGRSV